MSYRSLIVHLDDDARSEPRTAVAACLARTCDADLAGVYIVKNPDIPPGVLAMLPADTAARRLEERLKAQRDAEVRFRRIATESRLTAIEFRAPAGDELDAAVLHARYADLAILGQPAPDDDHADFERDLLHAVLMRSGRPSLIVPFVSQGQPLGERVLVAWKDTREAALALAGALPLLQHARSVVVTTVGHKPDIEPEDKIAESRVMSWLERHRIAAKFQREVAEDIDAGNLLLSRAADIAAHMIVMGAYSRPRVAELVLGGVTRLMLSSMTVPVLMAH